MRLSRNTVTIVFVLTFLSVTSASFQSTNVHSHLLFQAPPSPTTPNVGIWNDACFSSNMTVSNPQCGVSGATLAVGTTITVDVNVTNAPSFNGYEFSLFYDQRNLTLSKVILGTPTVFDNPFVSSNDTSTPGTIRESVVNLNGPFNGVVGVLAYFQFKIKGIGASPFVLAAGTSTPAEGNGAAQTDWTRLTLGANFIDVSTSDGYFQNENNPPLTPLKTSPYIKYVDSNVNNKWDPGEAVVNDTNNNGIYDTGDTVIAGSPSASAVLKNDPLIKYVDANANNKWDSGETVVYDINNNNFFLENDPVIAGSVPATPKLGPVAKFTYSPAKPQKGQTISFDASISFDADNPSPTALSRFIWDFGDGVVIPSQYPTINHSFGSQGAAFTGNFSVLLRVYDADNNFTGMSTQLIGITPPPFHDVAVSSVTVAPGFTQAGTKLNVSVVVQVTPKGTFDETFNLSITWGPPTKILANYTNQRISHEFGKNSVLFKTTLDTNGLSPGTYEVDAVALDPLDNDTSNNSAKSTFVIQATQTSPLPYIIGGAVAVVAAVGVVWYILRRRRRVRPEDDTL